MVEDYQIDNVKYVRTKHPIHLDKGLNIIENLPEITDLTICKKQQIRYLIHNLNNANPCLRRYFSPQPTFENNLKILEEKFLSNILPNESFRLLNKKM